MQFPRRDHALEKVRARIGIRLVDQSLVAVSCGPGLIGINAGNDKDLVLDLLPQRDKPGNIIYNAVFVVRGAGTDDQGELVALAGKDRFKFCKRLVHCL